MASAVTTQKLGSELAVKMYDFDPNLTTEVLAGYADMRDYEGILVAFFRTIGTSTATFKLNAYSDTSGSTAGDATRTASGVDTSTAGTTVRSRVTRGQPTAGPAAASADCGGSSRTSRTRT